MLILASASKARKALLERAGIPHHVIVSDVDESDFKNIDIRSLVAELSLAKAKDVISKISINSKKEEIPINAKAIIGCDSLFEFEDEIFGKPKNSDEAFSRLKKMSSNSGLLHTGHSLLFRPLLDGGIRQKEFIGINQIVISTKIYFKKTNSLELINYVNTGEPMKCAGGFSLEGKGGTLIKKIEGCYSNVIGLSLSWLSDELKKLELLY